jgi:primosomal protein N'
MSQVRNEPQIVARIFTACLVCRTCGLTGAGANKSQDCPECGTRLGLRPVSEGAQKIFEEELARFKKQKSYDTDQIQNPAW